MSEPEPLDQFAAGGIVEQRGGDKPEDYVPLFLDDSTVLPPPSSCACCADDDEDPV